MGNALVDTTGGDCSMKYPSKYSFNPPIRMGLEAARCPSDHLLSSLHGTEGKKKGHEPAVGVQGYEQHNRKQDLASEPVLRMRLTLPLCFDCLE
ncbi:hypothetical protein RHSIM_Rhsim01G0061900 [Rhododendron simsii]|uniref:Uncharacterized protein n=1 Tax=Rhododendron simsii TaxID=118357 RepID=A0A834HTA6_RHOSS|nr:hypothetical protein RHSIM_Rhsim01G0061900 [Rhododendron simsii]